MVYQFGERDSAEVGSEAAHYKPFGLEIRPGIRELCDDRTNLPGSTDAIGQTGLVGRSILRVATPPRFRGTHGHCADGVLRFFGVIDRGLAQVIVHQCSRLFGIVCSDREVDPAMHVGGVSKVPLRRACSCWPTMLEKQRRHHFNQRGQDRIA